jgi:TolB-like protein
VEASDGLRVAVLYFENEGNPELDMLRLGLAQMMISQLAGKPGLTVMERGRINDVLAELELQKTSAVDAETAVKLGELLGVDRLVLGGYMEAAGQFVLTGRVVDVESGEVIGGTVHSGVVADFVPMLGALSTELLPVLQAAPAPATDADEVGRSDDLDTDGEQAKSEEISDEPLMGLDLGGAGAAEKIEEVAWEEEEDMADDAVADAGSMRGSPSSSRASRKKSSPKPTRKSGRARRTGGAGGASRSSAPGAAPAPQDSYEPPPPPVDSLGAAMALSRALDLLDRGEREAARGQMAIALELDPGLSEARLQLERMNIIDVEMAAPAAVE